MWGLAWFCIGGSGYRALEQSVPRTLLTTNVVYVILFHIFSPLFTENQRRVDTLSVCGSKQMTAVAGVRHSSYVAAAFSSLAPSPGKICKLLVFGMFKCSWCIL
jgi:hypothetical protein